MITQTELRELLSFNPETGLFIGKWPSDEVDHVNLVKSDNRWSNLREATRSQNTWNTAKPKTNTSGFKGVSWHKQSNGWQAQINSHSKCHHRVFRSKLHAALWIHAMRKKLHGNFAKAA